LLSLRDALSVDEKAITAKGLLIADWRREAGRPFEARLTRRLSPA
jgi:hypothetical protein